MKLYIAKVVFRIICGKGSHTPQFDEQLRMIHAVDEVHAYEKALQIAEREQEEFLNQYGQMVHWKFIGIPELYNLDELKDGVEICSRVHETNASDNYIDLIHHKARSIRMRVVNETAEPA